MAEVLGYFLSLAKCVFICRKRSGSVRRLRKPYWLYNMVLKALKPPTFQSMQWVWQGRAEQAELSHKQLSGLTIKQTSHQLFSERFIFSHATWENVSEAGENCCLPQSLDQLLSDERKQFAILLSRYRGDKTELTPADSGLARETRRRKQNIYWYNSPAYQRLRRWGWRAGIYQYKDRLRQNKNVVIEACTFKSTKLRLAALLCSYIKRNEALN